MKLFRYLKRVRKEINWIAFIAFLIWVIKILWLNSISTSFSYLPKIGIIVEQVTASIVSSYIFYFLVVHWKDEQDKETVSPYISDKIKLIVSVCENQLLFFENTPTIVNSGERKLKLDTLEKCDIEEVFRGKTPNERNAPLAIGVSSGNQVNTTQQVAGNKPEKIQKANWSEYITHSNQKVQIYIENLLKKITCLDSELVDLLTSLEDSIELSMLSHIDSSLPDLTHCSQEFFDYCMLVKKLKEYEKTKLAKYSEAK